jgi:DNA-binding MarR family transcriptional regulator
VPRDSSKLEPEATDDVQIPVPDEYLKLWVLIAQTKDAISKAREREYARYGINNERRAILYIIANNGGQAKPVDIAREIFRELHSVTELLKRMEEDGLLTRSQSSSRSRFEVRLTETGRDVLKKSANSEIDKIVFSVLKKSERERLSRYLWKVRTRVLGELGIQEWQLNLSLNRGPAEEREA